MGGKVDPQDESNGDSTPKRLKEGVQQAQREKNVGDDISEVRSEKILFTPICRWHWPDWDGWPIFFLRSSHIDSLIKILDHCTHIRPGWILSTEAFPFVTPKHLWSLSAVLWLIGLFLAIAICCFRSQPSQDDQLSSLPAIPVQSFYAFPKTPNPQEILATPAFQLSDFERPIRLPDLRPLLLFYGSTERPDRPLMSRSVQFGLRGVTTVSSAQIGSKVFFRFDLRSNRWNISETETSLFCVFSPAEGGIQASVTAVDEKNNEITTPAEFHTFLLTPTAPPQSGQTAAWFIDEIAVDGSLFDRQGAVWWGQDEVIKDFGGEEMAKEASRQRVQFSSGDDAYVIWVAEDDCFMYDDGRWQSVQPGNASVHKPLAQARAVDGKAIHFQVWNPEGTARCNIDLNHRQAGGELVVPEIKLIGAKSRRQWIAEICSKRITLAPDDWVVLSGRGPVQLNTTRLLDDYLQGKIIGNLIILSGIEKVDGDLCFVGSFYDATRTRKKPFCISLYRSWEKKDKEAKGSKEEAKKPSEDQDDDDDEDDEDSISDEDLEDDDFEDEE